MCLVRFKIIDGNGDLFQVLDLIPVGVNTMNPRTDSVRMYILFLCYARLFTANITTLWVKFIVHK